MRAVSANRLRSAKRVVVKIGSALLVDQEHGTVRRKWLEALAEDVAAMKARGQDVILVSSGAVAVGRRYLGLGTGKLKLEDKQAAAATGQIRLAHAYQEVLGHHDIIVSQVLLTLDDTEGRRRYINARNTLNALLKRGAVPLINENDTVATEELRFGDNDRLGARVAAMAGADVLVLLSDIDGLYTANPNLDPGAKHIPVVDAVTPEVEAMAGDSSTNVGSGGMITKLAAAKICLMNGCAMAISVGKEAHALKLLEDGGRATWFIPSMTPAGARKRWIACSLQPMGGLVLDDGALKALKAGKSLLPIGVTKIEGEFQKGDAVVIRDKAGRELARGLAAYSSGDARKIIGRPSSEIEDLLGYRGRDELVHRDDLALS
ncbi:MAG: glutamate 5-kinase [Alphaproteobacteria bacterium]|nr:glutamate 5-kinase [Alphaproteobacteria bacterium]MBF0251972.1 glutamate 5-kinase [Alphaproteobacteria bacterium]